jgi:hypothetical protein
MSTRISVSRWNDDFHARRAINDHADEIDAVETEVETLQRLVKQQADELLMLRALLVGLVEVMRSKGSIDEAELDAQVSKVWEQLTAPPPPVDPNANMPKPVKRDERPITCAKCGKSVPAYRTNITAQGEVCDSCSNG